ncbi:hypothetical protein [Streptomyces sp. NBC_00316]|uniref:hypothetical protein n=1 Tax=Streptomyces sp. NBC_00316 TaxID=2975710 RepID=UPI002E29E991|nr:hypothetical protein [Streptomyces sp. NBC_00316]
MASCDDQAGRERLSGRGEPPADRGNPTPGRSDPNYGGWPVYRYAGDTKPGDLNGQGIGGTWFAVGTSGKKVTR